MWNLKQNKSICVYPYVHKHYNLDDNEGLCCFTSANYGKVGQDNTSNRQKVIDAMQKGLPVKGCETCYTRESEGYTSPRIEKTKQWINRFGEPEKKGMAPIMVNINHDIKVRIKADKISTS